MPIIIPANSAVAGGLDVANSIRLDNNAYLNRTFSETGAGAGGGTFKWTLSLWFKRSALTNEHVIMSRYVNSGKYVVIKINGNNKIEYRVYNGGDQARYTMTAVLRDTSAWMNFVIAQDSTLSTAADRVKFFINGSRVTAFDTQTIIGQNVGGDFNTASPHQIGAFNGGDEFQGYMSQICFVDNVQYDADKFGEFDEDSSIWKPIDVSGLSTGATSFFLAFENSSALGEDSSGDNNNFSVNNITAADQSTDTCTNNFCTINGAATAISSTPTLTQGNLTLAGTSWRTVIGTFALTKGKWYWECKGSGSAGTILSGIASTAVVEAGGASYGLNGSGNTTIGVNLPSYAYHGSSGGMYYSNTSGNGNGQAGGSWGTAYTSADLISVYLDLDNNKLYMAKNDALQVSGVGYDIQVGYDYYPVCIVNSATQSLNFGIGSFNGTAVSSAVADVNGFGAFEYDPSRGGATVFNGAAKDFLAICSKNVAEFG